MTRCHNLVFFAVAGLGACQLFPAARPAAAYGLPFVSPAVVDAGFADALAMAAADVDGDGKLDLVAAGAGGVAWWKENAGVYTRTTISAGAAIDVALGDLDGDGDLDAGIATAGSLLLARGAAGGTSWTVTTVAASLAAKSVAMADIDGDGRLDLLAAFATGADWWRNSAGDGSAFVRTTIGALTSGSGAAAGDCDNDGDLDVVTTSDGASDRLRYWANTAGNGSSFTGSDLATGQNGARSPLLADLDGDGFLDAAAALADDESVRAYLNDWTPGNGTWPSSLASTANQPRSLAPVDLDLDGDLDLLLGGGDSVAWLENRRNFNFTGRGIGAAIEGRLAAGDFDRDGDLDLMYGGAGDDTLFFLPNDGGRRSFLVRPQQDLETVDGARGLAAGDLDNDGDLDLALAAFASNQVRWEENTPAGWLAHALPGGLNGAFGAVVADLDGDGDNDVVAAGDTAGSIAWWRNDWPLANTFVKLTVGALSGARGVAVGDVDRDGDLDVAGAGIGDDLALFTNNGAASFTRTFISTTFNRAHSAQLADVDGDGDLDLLAAGNTADEIAWWQNAAGTFTKRNISGATIDGAYSVHAVDLDQDGDLDAVSTSESSDLISFWSNDGPGDGLTWSRHDVGTINQAENAGFADFDGDGDLDVVGVGWKDGGRVAWYRNNNFIGTSWTKTEITITFNGAGSLAVADFDRNGLPDFAATAETADKVSIWLNGGGQYALATTVLSGASLPAGAETALFRLQLTPRGLATDNEVELAMVELLLEEAPGDPLGSAEADALLEQIEILRDNPSGGTPGVLDGSDISLATTSSFTLSPAGVLRLEIADNTAQAAIAQGGSGNFFVTATTAASYAALAIRDFKVSHLHGGSRAEDRDYDTELRPEWSAGGATALFPVNDFANLAIDVSDSPDPVQAGNNLTYTVSLTNAGPDIATGVVLSSALPAGTSLVSTTGCTQDPSGVPSCSVGTIAVGATVPVTIVVAVPANAGMDVPLDFSASVASALFDPQTGDNSAGESTAVTAVVDVGIEVSSPMADYAAGAPLHWLAVVTNNGPGAATAVSVLVDLPAGLNNVAYTCTGSGGALCNFPSGTGDVGQLTSIPAGGTLVYRIRSQVPSGATLPFAATGTISVGPSTIDSVTANNSDGHTVIFGNKIFYDGFESGNTTGWSLTTP
jgi:uncharacterized repeat protein (TIGR01451 family)